MAYPLTVHQGNMLPRAQRGCVRCDLLMHGIKKSASFTCLRAPHRFDGSNIWHRDHLLEDRAFLQQCGDVARCHKLYQGTHTIPKPHSDSEIEDECCSILIEDSSEDVHIRAHFSANI
eukprot:3225446-Pyramimonas_sp.AAC.2